MNVRAFQKQLVLAMAFGSVALSPLAHADLVTNGGFESGSFSGWTVSSPGSVNLPFVDPTAAFAHGGTHSAVFQSAIGDDVLSQTLSTLAGETYDISFWLRTTTGSVADNHFAFNWDGGAAELDVNNLATSGYVQYTYALTASSSSTSIGFSIRNRTGFSNLDDISVTARSAGTVPEPGSLALVGIAILAAAGLHRWRHA